MCISNNRFFYQCKIFKNIRIILTEANINNIGSAKFENIQFFNIIEIRLTKSKVIVIVITTIKTESSKN